MSGVRCVYPGCFVKTGDGITLFNFPVWGERRRQWLTNIGLQEANLNSNSRVCKNHFSPQFLLRYPNGPDRLRDDAVPTMVGMAVMMPLVADNLQQQGALREPVTDISAQLDILNRSAAENQPIAGAIPNYKTPQSSQQTTSGSSATYATSAGTSGSGSEFIPSPENTFLTAAFTENLHSSTTDTSFIIKEEYLRLLFRRCQECGNEIKKEVRFYRRGGHLRVEIFCDHCCRSIEWHSDSFINGMSAVNLQIPAATITAGKTFEDVKEISNGMQLAMPSKTEFYNVAKSYIYPGIRKLYLEYSDELFDEIRKEQAGDAYSSLRLAIDTRYSRPGHCATYATTSAIDLKTKKVLMSVVTVKHVDADSSPALELQGTKILLRTILSGGLVDNSEDSGPEEVWPRQAIRISAVVTDDHAGIIKFMEGQYPSIDHHGDIWHFAKRIKKRLLEKAKLVANQELLKWTKSISNFIWLICEACHGDKDLLEEYWKSMTFHVRGVHSWQKGRVFQRVHKCLHAPIGEEAHANVAWLEHGSSPYEEIRSMAHDPLLIASIRRCSGFMQTSEVESFHSSMLKFLPKRLPFDKEAFDARTCMAIMRFNENIGRALATTSSGEPKTRLALPPSTGTWVAKAQLIEKTSNWRQYVLAYIEDERKEKSANYGHNLGSRTLRTEPTQASFIPRPNRQDLEEEFRKRRRLQQQ